MAPWKLPSGVFWNMPIVVMGLSPALEPRLPRPDGAPWAGPRRLGCSRRPAASAEDGGAVAAGSGSAGLGPEGCGRRGGAGAVLAVVMFGGSATEAGRAVPLASQEFLGGVVGAG